MDGLDLEAIRTSLRGATGRQYWRSLEELADTPEFREMLHREFPVAASELDDGVSRRNFLRVMGASLALAGMSGACYRQPDEAVVPYVQQPEILIPGRPLFFATAIPFRGYGIGALVESHMGRPTKVEGNPDHPASLGATNVFVQASVLTLYDPNRSQNVTRGGAESTWASFLTSMQPELARLRDRGGAGLRLLTGTVTSPTLIAQIQSLLQNQPEARWHRFDPVGRDGATRGAAQAFGQPVDAIYDFELADVVVSLESNFLFDEPGSLAYARQFTRRRRVARSNDPGGRAGQVNLSRLYVAEATPTITGAMADARLPVKSSRILQLALAMLGQSSAPLTDEESRWVRQVQESLEGLRGRSIVIAGDSQPPAVHAIAHAMNDALGNVGATVRYVQPVAPPPNDDETLEALCRDIDAGHVDTLVILDSNPVYTAPADLNVVERLKKVRLRVHAGLYFDETAFWSQWHVPLSHALESWSDLRAFNGAASIVQPLIQPLYATHTPHEVLAVVRGQANPQSSYDIVRDFWRTRLPKDRFEQAWRESLHLGLVLGEQAQDVRVTPNLQAVVRSIQLSPTTAPATTQSSTNQGIEIVFRPDPTVWDGEYANNAWLQELPKPLTKLTWDNAAYVSPATAHRLSVGNEDVVHLRHQGRELEAAVFVVPGHADDCVSITLGYGRQARALRVGYRTGFNAYAIRTSSAPWFAGGLEVARAYRTYPLAQTQRHFNMEGRDLVRTIAADEVGHAHDRPGHADHHMPAEEAHKAGAVRRVPLSIYPDNLPSDPPYKTHAWGMSIDLSSCIGCNACVVACVAENNIPVVGKEQVARAREMHWIRIDTYHWSDDADAAAHLHNPQTTFQPMLCQHCEKAPCEVVCPVAATTHSDDGLNEMTYNRCIGTRYCSNNCPYKVRRFNFFEYNAPNQTPPQRRMQYNPDVTVRSRGVMEKCTFCVQRIRQGEMEARKQNRRVFDGEVIPACAQACPTQAIVFGDIADPKSLVHELKFGRPFEELDYGVLNEELGTRPRTTYLKKIVHGSPSPGTPGEGRGEGSATTRSGVRNP